MFKFAIVAALCIASVQADLYLHMPKGSNDRLNEANTNRANGNRLFDSQNNAKGGYCVSPAMNYYEGSLISVEWTNQHGCGSNPKLYCNIVAQYMCGNSDEADGLLAVRDGTSTNTISEDTAGTNSPTAVDSNNEFTYGMHESVAFYQDCKARQRNNGLWLADRNVPDSRPATHTRQNNNGNRRGLECPEERDYYPYWHPTPWRDIAVLTHNTAWCDFYKKESENVKMRGHCLTAGGAGAEANNKKDCQDEGHTWTEEYAFGHPGRDGISLPAPDCVLAPWSRDNHLGNGLDGFANSYNWTLPTSSEEPCIEDDNCNCVFRLRYNISTTDLDFGTGPSDVEIKTAGDLNSGNQPEVRLDWKMNGDNSPIKGDPTVEFDDVALKLAIDTTQFGRTFQDRTHVFHILKRPSGVANAARIYNLGVRGKRGNIVQTYPAVEYDFTPQNLEVRVGDIVHFQWTGCDTNPAGNAGEGTQGTDRSNIVQLGEGDMQHLGYSHPVSDEWMQANPDRVMFPDSTLRQYMAYGDQDPATCEKDLGDQDPNNCHKLNKMSQHFDAGLIRMNSTGEFYYMSSRNNNFSNRGQKGSLVVRPVLPIWAIVLIAVGGVLALGSAGVAFSMFYARSHPHSGVANLMSRLS